MEFGAVRELIHRRPGRRAWQRLVAMLDAQPDRAELEATALPYLGHHLEAWPAPLRRAPRAWLDRAIAGEPVPELRLARAIDWTPWMKEGVLSEDAYRLIDGGQLGELDTVTWPGVHVDEALISRVLTAPCFARVRVLKMPGFGLDLDMLRALGQSPMAPHVRALHISTQSLYTGPERVSFRVPTGELLGEREPGDAARALMAGNWASLDELNVISTQLYNADLEQLAQWEGSRRLRVLKLGNAGFGRRGIAALLRAEALPALRELDIHGDLVDGDRGDEVCSPMNYWTEDCFEDILLEGQPDLVSSLLDGGLLPQLEVLRSHGSPALDDGLTQASAARLIGALGPRLRELSVPMFAEYDEDVAVAACRKLVESPALASLEVLRWSMSGGALADLFAHEHMRGLRSLSLSEEMSPQEWRALLGSPHVGDLEHLQLWRSDSWYGWEERVAELELDPDFLEQAASSPNLSPRLRGTFRVWARRLTQEDD